MIMKEREQEIKRFFSNKQHKKRDWCTYLGGASLNYLNANRCKLKNKLEKCRCDFIIFQKLKLKR